MTSLAFASRMRMRTDSPQRRNGERIMRYKMLPVAATVALGIALTPLWTPSLAGAVQFLFTGNCVQGTFSCGPAEATLILMDTYEFGSPITPANFVSLHYDSLDEPIHFEEITGSSPGLNDDGSLVGELQLLSNQFAGPPPFTITFTVDPDGRWELLPSTVVAGLGGTGGQFTPLVGAPAPVPEPSTWAMMLVGFAVLGFAAYGRSRRESVASAAAD
jgi:PEP-CTERM motif